MTFAVLATQLLARTTSLLDSRHNVNMTRRLYLKAVVPIGFLYSGSMACSNLTYLHLNVAFIQMLKVWTVLGPRRRGRRITRYTD
jgi:hypothetical protein